MSPKISRLSGASVAPVRITSDTPRVRVERDVSRREPRVILDVPILTNTSVTIPDVKAGGGKPGRTRPKMSKRPGSNERANGGGKEEAGDPGE
jgi:hypothetical protein